MCFSHLHGLSNGKIINLVEKITIDQRSGGACINENRLQVNMIMMTCQKSPPVHSPPSHGRLHDSYIMRKSSSCNHCSRWTARNNLSPTPAAASPALSPRRRCGKLSTASLFDPTPSRILTRACQQKEGRRTKILDRRKLWTHERRRAHGHTNLAAAAAAAGVASRGRRKVRHDPAISPCHDLWKPAAIEVWACETLVLLFRCFSGPCKSCSDVSRQVTCGCKSLK